MSLFPSLHNRRFNLTRRLPITAYPRRSDKLLYAELLTQFFVTTEALGALIDEASEFDLETLEKYKGFHLDYLSDLSSLLGPSHLAQIDSFKTPSSLKYIQALKENASHESLLAGIIILWGPMVIGGGAMLYPKVKKAYGGGEKLLGAKRLNGRKENVRFSYRIIRASSQLLRSNSSLRPSTRLRMCQDFRKIYRRRS